MSYAADTNILARSVQENHPMHTTAKESVKLLLQRGEEVYGLAQNGISHLLTFNGRDFKRFRDVITVIEPNDIFGPPSVSP